MKRRHSWFSPFEWFFDVLGDIVGAILDFEIFHTFW